MNLLVIFITSAVASVLPLLGCSLFGTEGNHGLISFDLLFLLLMLIAAKKNLYWKLFFVICAFLYAIIGNEVGCYAAAGIYLILILFAPVLGARLPLRIVTFCIFSTIFFVADCGNFFYKTYELTLLDVWGLARFFWWGIVLFVMLPLIQLVLVGVFSRKILILNKLEIPHVKIATILLLTLLFGYGLDCAQNRFSLVEFSLNDYMVRTFTPEIVEHNPTLREDIKLKYEQLEASFPLLQTKQPTMYILVESWGVFKDVKKNEWILSLYDSINRPIKKGISLRQGSFTQSAELEDLFVVNGNSELLGEMKDRWKTFYIHGYNGNFYDREKNYRDYGFDTLIFKKELNEYGLKICSYGFTGICDSALSVYIDSLLTDSIPKFIYWTTLDGHTPYDTQNLDENIEFCNENQLNRIECIFYQRQKSTAESIIKLVNHHPEYSFVIRGDHRPPGSLEETGFVSEFYYRWVPIVIVESLYDINNEQ